MLLRTPCFVPHQLHSLRVPGLFCSLCGRWKLSQEFQVYSARNNPCIDSCCQQGLVVPDGVLSILLTLIAYLRTQPSRDSKQKSSPRAKSCSCFQEFKIKFVGCRPSECGGARLLVGPLACEHSVGCAAPRSQPPALVLAKVGVPVGRSCAKA